MQKSLITQMYDSAYGNLMVLFTLRQIDECPDYVLYDITLDEVYVENGDFWHRVNLSAGGELRCIIMDKLQYLYN